MMRVDYRYLRLVSVPFYVVAIVLLVLVFVPAAQHRRRRLGPLAAARPAAGDPPGRDRQAGAGHLSRPLVREARARRSTASGAALSPFLIIVAPIIALVFKEPDLGTTMVLTLTAFTMFFVAGANLFHLAADGLRRRWWR